MGAAQAWDGFLVAPENALAQAAATALARGEVAGLSPLVVHGPAGVGKSRLLAGLGAEWRQRRADSAVAWATGEAFVAGCAEAVGRPGGWAALRGRFRSAELFLLDELDGLARSPLAVAELIATLDALDEAGAAVAVAARAGPSGWGEWPGRLVSRLVGGLAVRIEPPGREVLRRYALQRARERGLRLPTGAVERMAEAADGFGVVDGWLGRIGFEARSGRAVDEAVAAVLDEPGAVAGRPTIEAVARAVAGRFGVSLRDLRSASRRSAIAGPRHLAIYLARRETGRSYAAIGAYFGRRDPATVRHSCAMAERRLAEDPALASAVGSVFGAGRWSA